ncbi:MAG: LrgB family protein [Burkholderiales bacterium]|nr:MAG: LrgB family protein [Burkholderiales bacterium]
MQPRLNEIWVYLSASPLLGLTVTLLAYQLAFAIYRRLGFHPLANPVPIAVALLVSVLVLTGTPYSTYFDGAQFVHFLLGPATVALAVPLYQQRDRIRRMWLPLAVGLAVGVLTAVVSAGLIAWALGASRETVLSLLPKSVTTPIAMGISERIGGLPSLTAVLVIATGMLGAVIARPLLDLVRVPEPGVRGFALGLASHGIGTARAFQVSEEAGAFAGLAMGLAALATAIAVPVLLALAALGG